jgi:plasmid stabilization system protein ParE
MHVILHPLAEPELLEAVRFYEDRAPGLGKDLLQDFQRAVDRIRDNPESGVKMGQLVRRLLLRRFPFSILYRTSGDELRVLALMHHRRRPGYWKGRR